MPDVNPSVALGINAPDPNQGLTTLSKIMTLGSQGLQIQGQKSQNQSLAANAQIAQQTAKENQAGAQLLSDPVGNGLVTADGTPTQNAQKIIMQAMPTTGSQHYEGLLNGAKSKVQFNSAVNDLRTNERGEIASAVSGAAAGAQSPDDITGALDNLVASKKGTPEYDNYQTIANTTKKIINHTAQKQKDQGQIVNPGDELWRKAAANIGAQILPVAQTAGAGGLNTPEQTTNAAGNILNRNRVTGALSAPPLQGAALNPTSSTVAANTTTAGGTAQDDNARNKQISDSVAPSRSAITLADQVSNLADQVKTGKFSSDVAKYAVAAGIKDPEIAARQLISKYSAQLKTVATANAPTDSARSQIDAGFPDPDTMGPEAIKAASEYIKGGMLMNISRNSNAQKFQATHNGTQGLRVADDQFTSRADPLMYTYQNLPKGPERTEFIKRHFSTPEQAKDFVNRKNAVEHYGGFEQ